MLYLRAKDIIKDGTLMNPLTQDVLVSTTQNAWIEIIPMEKESFDFVSFIDLADRITKKYVVNNFSTRGDTIKIKAVHKKYSIDNYSFKFDIRKDLSEIHVYIRDAIERLKKTVINNINYIFFKSFSENLNQFKIFSNDYKWKEHLNYPNSVIYVFGNYFAKKQSNTPLFLKYNFESFLDPKTPIRRSNPLIQGDIIKILNHLPGNVYYQYTDISKSKPFSKEKMKKMGCIINIDGNDKVLRSIVWIMPWFTQILNTIQFLELDASFKACRPYAFSIFHGIIFNSTIPFALTIGPSENEELFEILYTSFKKFNFNQNLLENKQVLSDMGPSIISFCSSHSMVMNFCHRHIIEVFGANSGIGTWVKKILQCNTKNEFLNLRNEINKEIDAFLSIKYKSPEIDLNREPKINDLKIMLLLPEEVEKSELAEKIKKSNYYMPKWANWLRRDFHIPRCTNHAEGFHGNINSKLRKKGISSFKTGFCKIVDFIVNYIENRKESYGMPFQRKHSKLISKVRDILKGGPDCYLKCSNIFCECEDQIYNALIYGVEFPCIHTILSEFISSEFFQNFSDQFHINFSDFFLLCFKFFPNSYYEKTKFELHIDDIVVKIVKNFLAQTSETWSEEDTEKFYGLAFGFLQSFSYTLPPFVKINTNQYTDNNIKSDENLKSFKFTVRSHKNNKSRSKMDSNELLNSYIKDQDSEKVKLIKRKYCETKNEIAEVYPQLKEEADGICFDRFLDNLYVDGQPIQTNDILNNLALFKIDCWEIADSLATDF